MLIHAIMFVYACAAAEDWLSIDEPKMYMNFFN